MCRLVDFNRTTSFENTPCYSYSFLNWAMYQIDVSFLSPSRNKNTQLLPLSSLALHSLLAEHCIGVGRKVTV